MENKFLRFLLLISAGIFMALPFFAEEKTEKKAEKKSEAGLEKSAEENSSAETQTKTADENWQILEWDEEEPLFVLKYEVVIEQYSKKKKTYVEINSLMTEDNTSHVQIKPFLEPGSYRFKVITYNLIGVPEVESEWKDFNIYQAYQPDVSNVSVNINKSGTIFLDEINDGKITVSGKNLFKGPEDEFDLSFTKYKLISANGKKTVNAEITEYSDNNKKLSIQLDMKQIDTGKYYFVAEDASGLKNEKDSSSELKVKFKKRMDFDLSAGYGCPVVLFDNTIDTYMDTNLMPLSAAARMSFLPFKHRYGYVGIGLSGSFSRMIAEKSGYSIDGNLATGFGNLVFQMPFYTKPDKEGERRHFMTMDLHGGAGIVYFNGWAFHFPHNIDTPPFNSMNMAFDAGILFQVYLTQRLYLEPCTDFVMAVSPVNTFGMVFPSVSIGWQF